MALYLVSAKSISYVDVLVEADSPDKAMEFAGTDVDGSEYEEYDCDWETDNVEEVTPAMLKAMHMEGRQIYKANED